MIIRTEKDRQLGLYVGNRVGSAYNDDDVPALRSLGRAHGIISGSKDYETWHRATQILGALRDLKDEEAREKTISGLTEAKRRDQEAGDAYEELAKRLALTSATTLAGVFAKARVMRQEFVDNDLEFLGEGFVDNLNRHMRRLGPDDDAFARSLARDLIQLASKEADGVANG